MRLICLVDNTVQPGSPFWGEHGVAFLIEVEQGCLLFDTGASGTVLFHNMEAARVDPESISALAISHAHTDHTGGLPAFLERRPGLPIYAHTDLLRERFSQRGGQMRARGLSLGIEELRRVAELRLSDTSQEILPGIWTTGEITDRSEPEGRSANHFVRQGGDWAASLPSTVEGAASLPSTVEGAASLPSTVEGAASLPSTVEWVPDPYRDDLSLVVEGSQGLVLVCGCCHAGLLNTLAHVRRTFGRHPVAVIGGTHLVNADEAHLGRLVEVLERLGPPALYLNHCTGLRAYVALAQALGGWVFPCPVGTVLDL
jgi:7,8-dihydropterin-6-yl-methyl-4-(beta-D-ribofuranosyl)aminobenzene 5'-phosphate synthase